MKKLTQMILLAFALSVGAQAQIVQGAAFPSPASSGVTGKMPATKGKVVLYDFWASWCLPCRKSFPEYTKLYQKYKGKGLVVVAVGTDKNPADSAKFLKGLKPMFPVVFDHSQKFVAKVRPSGMPTAYLVGKDGRVIHVHKGFDSKTIKDLEKRIEAALK
ncbi:MAG: redoxin family protein [Akkermansiaceae bacterium]|jgi:cytochrome c biogenesis protein CcmG, thiol:disulfide interchange protein DsbE